MVARQERVVILGGGFAGLEAAKRLAKLPVAVTLVDRHNHHCFQPLLYQVATGALSTVDVAWPIRRILRGQANATVLLGTVTGIDTARACVETEDFSLPYDHLIIATGSTHSYFGHDEWAAAAPGLKTIDDAMNIRRRILLAFERAETAHDEEERRRLLTFVVVGGGPTGVEMAGAIAEVARLALADEFRIIDPRSARVVLIEAGPRLLPALPDELSRYAASVLARMGVEIITDQAVSDCDGTGVKLDERRIAAGCIVWAAGVTASPAARWLGIESDKSGRIAVAPDLTVPGHREIFVVGDCAAVKQKDGKPVPGLAPAAKQMGEYAARVIAARVMGRPVPDAFDYQHRGDLATIGRKAAAVQLKKVRLTGFVGWAFWSVAHVYFLVGLRHRVIVGLKWFWEYLSPQRGARVIAEPAGHEAQEAEEEVREDEEQLERSKAAGGRSDEVQPAERRREALR